MRNSDTYETLREADETIAFYGDVAMRLEYLRANAQTQYTPPDGAARIPDSVTDKICNAVNALDEALAEIDSALGNAVRAKLRLSEAPIKG